MIKIAYLINEDNLVATSSNDDLDIVKTVDGAHHQVVIKAKKHLRLVNAAIDDVLKLNESDLVFLNGYQSWTDTMEANLTFKERNVKKLPKLLNNMFAFDRYGDTLLYDYDKNKLHGYDVFYVKGEKEFFSYSLNYKKAYLIYEIDKKAKGLSLISACANLALNEGEEFVLFDYYQFDDFKEGLNSFNSIHPLKDTNKVFGYTSWYNYYQNINEAIILRDLKGLDARFNLFQIDDGYEAKVGDWLDIDKEKFPNGLKGIVDEIHEKGYKAGIWLAPFVAEEKSKLFSEHNDYFKKENGECVKCGANWSGFYALDFENDDAKLLLSNSIWVDEELTTDAPVFQELADKFYCYGYQTPFKAKINKANDDIKRFISYQTRY